MQAIGAPFTTTALAVGTMELTKEHTLVIESKLDEVRTVFVSEQQPQNSEKKVDSTGNCKSVSVLIFYRRL
jgi:hypothetical protein